MSFFDSLRYRLRSLVDPRAHDRELREEMDFHLDLESMQQIHRADTVNGAEDAPFAARRRLPSSSSLRSRSASARTPRSSACSTHYCFDRFPIAIRHG